jgi:hypothetical protein
LRSINTSGAESGDSTGSTATTGSATGTRCTTGTTNTGNCTDITKRVVAGAAKTGRCNQVGRNTGWHADICRLAIHAMEETNCISATGTTVTDIDRDRAGR